uniref:Uncharacterized protein n=1 Tax=Oreochromis aureus TaxID=47969 RepID=A0AAZ1XSW1_OREAU
MSAFDHSKTDALFQFSHISHSTQEHLKKVYSSLAICMCLAAVGSLVYIYLVACLVTVSRRPPRSPGVVDLSFGGYPHLTGVVYLVCRDPHNPETERKRLAFLEGFALLTGFSLGPILGDVIAVDPNVIATALWEPR